ncbi:MAG: MBL fold metallo-hydrolase [Deltaproteobacteria bacterium]|nr:MBL fold metallo-hydrolase [Deltaproteobacteria bacterium]
MIFKILGCGTSTGVPLPGCKCAVCLSKNPKNWRSRTSAVIKARSDFNVLIDTSTDLRYQSLTHGVEHVNAVLYTHAHADHILGLDDLRSFNFTQRQIIPCYGTRKTLSEIKRCFYYIFEPDQEYEGGMLPQVSLNPIEHYRPFNLEAISVQPFLLMHGRTEVTGFRIGGLAYATDCNSIPNRSWELLKNLDCLVLDALRYEPHNTHFTIDQAIAIAEELKPARTYLVHMSHTVDYDEASRKLPEGIELAYDGLEIPF